MSTTHRGLAALALCAALSPVGARAEVFINEIHYDDRTASGDTGERIEVVATAGESLSGYRIYLYNGTSSPNSGTFYDNDLVPAGSLGNCGAQVRFATVSYPSNGIQNGANDAIALVNPSGGVVQFLSYEGTVRASNGPASGRTSVNLPVSETNDTLANTSLQLGGTGTGSASFTWRASATQTFGACNGAQSFSAPNPPPTVTGTTPANGATGFPAAGDLGVNFSESVTLGSGAFTLQCSLSGNVGLSHPTSGSGFVISTTTALRSAESCTLTVVASQVTDAGGARLAANRTVAFTVAEAAQTGYYSRVNTSSASQLRCSLHAIIRGHTAYPYSGSGTSTWTILEIADENPNNTAHILDAYRNRSYPKVSGRAGTGTGLTYNREHTWPNSLGFGSATGNLGLPNAPYTDTHMLYLTDTNYNADRGNMPYADCALSAQCGERVTEANNGAGGGSGVYPGNSNWFKGPNGNTGSFQVWNKRRGDMARAVLYMAIRYEGGVDPTSGQTEPDLELTNNRAQIVITSSSPAYMGLLSTLLAWHQADPPDAAERERNEVIYSFQGNRNPFIDHPEWATNALFTSAKPASCSLN
ncbi:endonuclease [Arenimonas sp. MALMAid1274]|uniref:endonuclease n=1 Tax=Arenimonas sp. MALMAid1274 TaxID=3411630 RepID=UPI003BA0563B